jgi:DNA-binding transcriptional ArsR family regulator
MIIVHTCTTFVKQLREGIVNTQLRPEATAPDLSAVLHALSDPVRRSIVERLARDGDVPCGGFGLTVTPSTRTHHFRVLREAGLIAQRDEGNRKLNSLRRADIDASFPGLLEAVLSRSVAP